MKWPFSRKNDQTSVPAEIQEYYESERRERTGVAWLLAFSTLLITIGLAVILFFGGRWVYRKIANNNDNQAAQTVQQDVEDQADGPFSNDNNDSTDTDDSGDSDDNDSSTSPSGTSDDPTTTPPTTPGSTTPSTGDTPLPDTGPGDVLAIFTVTTIAGAAAHRIVYRRHTS